MPSTASGCTGIDVLVFISAQISKQPYAAVGKPQWTACYKQTRKTKDMPLESIFTSQPSPSFKETIQRLWTAHVERRRVHAVYAQTRRELSAMSKRELADIGIDGSDIDQIAAEAAAISQK